MAIVVLGVLLGSSVGVAMLPGLAFLIVCCAVQWSLGQRVTRLRSRTARQTDARVKLMRDVLSGIEQLRVHAWEAALYERVCRLRAKESLLIWRQVALH